MPRGHRPLQLLAGALLVLGCRPASVALTDAQKAALADTAKAVAQQVIDRSNSLDFQGALALYSPDSDARFVESGMMFPSRDALTEAYAGFGPTLEYLDNQVDSWDVVVLGPDAVAITAPIHVRIKAKGRPEYRSQYVWTGIVQRRHGAWKFVQTHESWRNPQEMLAAVAPPPSQSE